MNPTERAKTFGFTTNSAALTDSRPELKHIWSHMRVMTGPVPLDPINTWTCKVWHHAATNIIMIKHTLTWAISLHMPATSTNACRKLM